MKLLPAVLPVVALLVGPALCAAQDDTPVRPSDSDTPRQEPAPATLVYTAEMDPDVVALIRERVAAAEASPGDASVHIELGLAYEANTFWMQAQRSYENVLALMPDDEASKSERAQWQYRLGVVQYNNGDILGAIENTRAAANVFKNTAVIQARLGHMLFEIGALDEAEAAWRNAIASEETTGQGPWASSRWGLARIMIQREKYAEAVELLEEAVAIDPAFRPAYYQLGIAYGELGREDDSELAYARGVNAYISYPPDPHQQRLVEYERGYGRRMMRIENLLGAGRVDDALLALQAVRTERPKDHRVLNMMAKAYQANGRLPEALSMYELSAQVEPDDYTTVAETALVLLNMGRYDEAVAKAQAAVQMAPMIGRTHYFLGLALNFSAAAQGQQQPQTPETQQQASQLKQSALASLQNALALGCVEPQLFEYLARISAELGRLDAMVEYGEQFALKSPDNPGAQLFLGQVYWTIFSQGRREADYLAGARKAAERVIAHEPSDPQVEQLKGVAKQLLGFVEEAEKELNQPGPPLPPDK